LTPTRTSLGLGWSRISWSRDIAAGVSVSAALRGLNANLGCFTAEAGVAAVDDEVVIDVAEGVAFRGGAGGV
jgi:hypothetical protein